MWTHQLCWRGAAVLAVGSAVAPVAEFFGAKPGAVPARRTSRLANVTSTKQGLFAGSAEQLRLALPESDRVLSGDLGGEFGATAWAKDTELIGASHVFRPVHLLHAGAVESADVRPLVLANLVRLLRERGGRAF